MDGSKAEAVQKQSAAPAASVLQRKCPNCRKKKELLKKLLQRQAISKARQDAAPAIVYEVLRSPGQPLDRKAQEFMGSRFGHDFSRVRIHDDSRAAESARALDALAYTVGRDVVFGRGQYSPGTGEGRSLIAHEMVHVVQQSGSSESTGVSGDLEIGEPDDPLEDSAEQFSKQLTYGDGQEIESRSIPGLRLQRKTVCDDENDPNTCHWVPDDEPQSSSQQSSQEEPIDQQQENASTDQGQNVNPPLDNIPVDQGVPANQQQENGSADQGQNVNPSPDNIPVDQGVPIDQRQDNASILGFDISNSTPIAAPDPDSDDDNDPRRPDPTKKAHQQDSDPSDVNNSPPYPPSICGFKYSSGKKFYQCCLDWTDQNSCYIFNPEKKNPPLELPQDFPCPEGKHRSYDPLHPGGSLCCRGDEYNWNGNCKPLVDLIHPPSPLIPEPSPNPQPSPSCNIAPCGASEDQPDCISCCGTISEKGSDCYKICVNVCNKFKWPERPPSPMPEPMFPPD